MKLKWFILALLWMGLGWTAFVALRPTEAPTLCLFRLATGYPCPACGSTRALAHLFHGHFWESVLINPFGLVVFVLAVPTLVILMADAITGSHRFEHWVQRVDGFAKRHPWVLVAVGLLVLANWIWNLVKWNYG